MNVKASHRLWILDGHNIIFALSGLAALQTSRRGAEARSLLVERLIAFAHEIGEQVLLVFDGNDLASSPDARKTPLFEAVYGRRGEGGADRRILGEARRRSAQGFTVTVVTDDVRTLAIELPRSVRRLGVREFWRLHIEPPEDEGEKRIEADFSDIEKALLALEPESQPVYVTAAGHRAASKSPAETAASREAGRGQEEIRRKRERGRRRYERTLKRSAKAR